MKIFFTKFNDAPAETTFFSRFPDALTPGTAQISTPEIYTIHITESCLVETIRRTFGPDGWVEHPPLVSESVELAREMVPPERILRADCPRSYAIEAYEVAAP